MAKKKERPGVMFYHDDWRIVRETVSKEELGFLTDAFLEYSETKTEPSEYPNADVKFVFRFLKGKVDRDMERYDAVCEEKREAGKRGRQVLPHASTCKEHPPNDSTCYDCYPTVTPYVTPSAKAEETVNITANESVTPISASHGNSRFETVQRGTDRCPPFTVKDDEFSFKDGELPF